MTTPPRARLRLCYFGALRTLDPPHERVLLDRTTSIDPEVRNATAGILTDVRVRGDLALRELARRFDGVELDELEVPRRHWRAALDEMEPTLRRAMERSVRNISTVHRAFLPTVTEISPEPGVIVGRRPDPLERVGVYAPGGRAAYPSSVLMGAVPARVAGVREVVLASPPASNGLPTAVVLAAAELAGADRVFALGGAGAVGALAYGTASVPRVDRIVGPGNAYVVEAKLQVSGVVGIDSPAGPSELLVIADGDASSEIVAREMLAQAEHDPRACVVAIVVGEAPATRLRDTLERLLSAQQRRDIIEASLAGQGAILWTDRLDDAMHWARVYAPEHLLLCVTEVDRALAEVRNTGTVFVGETASVSFGDYMTGANHVLPTGGFARVHSGLSTLEFFRWTTYQRVDRGAAARLAGDVDVFARSEGLYCHAAAAQAWSGER
ncbi:MAG: histidinol dehydrogenase [Gemmatimonadaceae bacterium]